MLSCFALEIEDIPTPPFCRDEATFMVDEENHIYLSSAVFARLIGVTPKAMYKSKAAEKYKFTLDKFKDMSESFGAIHYFLLSDMYPLCQVCNAGIPEKDISILIDNVKREVKERRLLDEQAEDGDYMEEDDDEDEEVASPAPMGLAQEVASLLLPSLRDIVIERTALLKYELSDECMQKQQKIANEGARLMIEQYKASALEQADHDARIEVEKDMVDHRKRRIDEIEKEMVDYKKSREQTIEEDLKKYEKKRQVELDERARSKTALTFSSASEGRVTHNPFVPSKYISQLHRENGVQFSLGQK